MAKRGPKPKPTGLHVAEGTLHPTRHKGRAKEPRPKGAPTAPDWLDTTAKAHWQEVVGLLVPLKVATVLDTSALAMMCDAWSQWRRLRDSVNGDVEKETAAAYVLARLRKDWLDIAARFGMTASDRTRIEAEVDDIEQDGDRWVV